MRKTILQLSAAAFCAGFMFPHPALAAVPQSVALNLGVTGSGSVSATAGNRVQLCSAQNRVCTFLYPVGTVVMLKANPLTDYSFNGWSGACSTATPDCTVTLKAVTNVAARFSVVPQVTASITLSKALITPYGSTQLSWSSRNATQCQAAGDWSGAVALAGTQTVSPGKVGSYIYQLTCTNGSRSATAKATLTVALASIGQRIFAAQMTARNPDPASSCRPIAADAADKEAGFYWEIGDANGIITGPVAGQIAAGSVSPPGVDTPRYTRDTDMMIASASKWVYSTYFTEVAGTVQNGVGTMPAVYVPFLNFTSGYTNFTIASCGPDKTVGACMLFLNNETRTAAHIGKFDYDGGHLQVLGGGGDATLQADKFYQANLNNFALLPQALTQKMTVALAAKLPNYVPRYHSTELAGGALMSAANYAELLKGLVRKDNPLKMAAFLQPPAANPYAVCTNPADPACGPDKAVHTPVPANESWYYGLGHWIEADPKVGDGAYSSAGAFGFYPWVDATKTYYGVIARKNMIAGEKSGYASMVCGRAIRQAFMTGEVQP